MSDQPFDPRDLEWPDPEMVPVLRAMTPAQRFAAADSMFHFAQQTTANRVRAEHPQWTDEQVQAETTRRIARM